MMHKTVLEVPSTIFAIIGFLLAKFQVLFGVITGDLIGFFGIIAAISGGLYNLLRIFEWAVGWFNGKSKNQKK